jgi:hypothetical protein
MSTSTDTATTTHERRPIMTPPDAMSLAHQLELVTLERNLLRQALDQALAREQASRELFTTELQLLTQALQRVEQLEQRLQEAQKPPSPLRMGQSLRPIILELVRKHPQGITRRDMEEALQPGKSLKNTLNHMVRDGILTFQNAVYLPTPDAEATLRAKAGRRGRTRS